MTQKKIFHLLMNFLLLISCGCSREVKNCSAVSHINVESNVCLSCAGIEFSDSGKELILWTKSNLFIYAINQDAISLAYQTKLNSVQDISRHSTPLRSVYLLTKSENLVPKEFKKLKIAIKDYVNQEEGFLFKPKEYTLDRCVSLNGRFLARIKNEIDCDTGKIRVSFEILKDGEKHFDIAASEVTNIQNRQPEEFSHWGYLSPNGQYGYFVFCHRHRRELIPGIPRPFPSPNISKLYNCHILFDLEQKKIISIQQFSGDACIESHGYIPRLIVAIDEKRRKMAKLYVDERRLEIIDF